MKNVASAVWGGILAVLITACGGSGTDTARPSVTLSSNVLVGNAHTAVAPAEYKQVIQQLYMAFFGRPADAMGLAYWERHFSANNLPSNIAEFAAAYRTNAAVRTAIEGFSFSREAEDLYQGTNAAFVNAAYVNMFNRNAEPAGRLFWAGKLDRNELSRAEFVLIVLQAGQNDDAIVAAKKIQAAITLTDSLATEGEMMNYGSSQTSYAAYELLGKITRDTDMTAFGAEIQSFIITLTQSEVFYPGISTYAGFNHQQGLTDAPQYMARYRENPRQWGPTPRAGKLIYGEVPRTVAWTLSEDIITYDAPIAATASVQTHVDLPAITMLCERNASGGVTTTDVLVHSGASRLTDARKLAGKTFTVYRENCASSSDVQSVTFDSVGNGTFREASGMTFLYAETLTAVLSGYSTLRTVQGGSRLFNAYSYTRRDGTEGYALVQRAKDDTQSGSVLSIWSED